MSRNHAKEIFEEYNPADGVVRCPNGRAKIRKQLDSYARAAVNMYGIIKLNEFVEIFNTHNNDQITTDEVFKILLPNVLKYGWYGFYKDYIVQYNVLHDFGWVQHLERQQADKPRYIPPKDQFVLFEMEEFQSNNHWLNVRKFIEKTFGHSNDLIDGYLEIKSFMMHSNGMKELGPIMEKYGFRFESEEQVNYFFALLSTARNNTPMWENKGYTPFEMAKILDSERPNEMVVSHQSKVGMNQLCPCGSGKKYKKCCYLLENSGTSQLSYSERKQFYETWLKLLDFVNRKLKVVNYKFNLTYPCNNDESLIYEISVKLWEKPNLISAFINNNTSLSNEEVQLLLSWEKHFIKGRFVLLKYDLEYTVFMRMDKDEIVKLYAVKGITNSIADAIHCQLPTMLETVLLPFGEKIIYDSFLVLHPISFGNGMKKMFQEEYAESKRAYGIITKL